MARRKKKTALEVNTCAAYVLKDGIEIIRADDTHWRKRAEEEGRADLVKNYDERIEHADRMLREINSILEI